MAKFFFLKELIDQENWAAAKAARPVAAMRTLPSPAKITAVHRGYDEAAIWQMALQLEREARSRSQETCKLQND